MLTVQYAQSYADAGFTVVAVSPGVGIPVVSFRFQRSATVPLQKLITC